MNQFSHLKILIITFVIGTVLLAMGSVLFIHSAPSRWILLGLYTWSGALFIMYKIFRLLKESKHYGSFKK